jgi:radical SAM superfamily enzyme YgiQ (UPF0313 family)
MKPSILFLFPDLAEFDLLGFKFAYHLGTGYIISYLRQRGIQASQFVYSEPSSLHKLTEKILKQNIKIIGFTCFDTNYYFVKLFSQRLRKQNPDLTIIVGGPTATFSDKLIMSDNPAIDICVRGEGEITTYELIEHLNSGLDVSDVKGITYRLNGNLVRTEDRPFIYGDVKGAELDVIPSPYLENLIPLDGECGILTSRGCVFKCVYCNFSAMSRWTIRYHSIDRVMLELELISKHLRQTKEDIEDKQIVLFDDIFSLNIERAKLLCKAVIDKKIRLRLWAETRGDRVDKELLSLMKEAGFQDMNFGLESAVPRVLRNMKKLSAGDGCISKKSFGLEKRYVEKTKENVSLAKKLGIRITVSVIMGLPGATLNDDKKTIEFVRKLKVVLYYHNYLMIFAGTEISKTHKKFGIGIKSHHALLPFHTKFSYDVTKVLELENCTKRVNEERHIEKVMRIVTGAYDNYSDDGYSDFIISNQAVDDKMLKWLYESMVLCPVIVFKDTDFSGRLARANINKMAEAGLPITNFYYLTRIDKKIISQGMPTSDTLNYAINYFSMLLTKKRGYLSKLSNLEFMPFSNYMKCRPVKRSDKFTNKIVFVLSSLSDLNHFLSLMPSSSKLILDISLALNDYYFLDECRWSNRECPAINSQKVIIEEDGSIKPCANGCKIANVCNNRAEIVNKMSLLWKDAQKKRGCTRCPVRDNCSKCLFPYPVTDNEYCEIRKSKVNIDKVFKVLKGIRGIRTDDKDVFVKSKTNVLTCSFDNNMAIIRLGRKKYLYDLNLDKVWG